MQLAPIENFRDHPSRKGDEIKRIYCVNGLFYLANAEKLQQIVLEKLAYDNMGEPFRELARLYYQKPKTGEKDDMQISNDDAAHLLFFCQSESIDLDIQSELERNREFQRYYQELQKLLPRTPKTKLTTPQLLSMNLNDSEIHAILINSVRYCMTRHTYAASECADLIRSRWTEIPEKTRKIIIQDIDEAIRQNQNLVCRWPDDIREDWIDLRKLGAEYLLQHRSLPPSTNDQE